MHYIRLMRPPSVDISGRVPIMSMKISITTDLGDRFLSPEHPVRLCFMPKAGNRSNHGISNRPLNPVNGPAYWTAGMRVLKVDIPLEADWMRGRLNMRIEAVRSGEDEVGLSELQQLLPRRKKGPNGKSKAFIVPLSVDLVDGQSLDVAFRPFQFDFSPGRADDYNMKELHIEEDIGESIARHIWDAGVVTTALLADSCRWKRQGPRINDFMPIAQNTINVLELGSGVGILGIGISMFLHTAAKVQNVSLEQGLVLLTDLPEAEERANANIKRSQKSAKSMFGGTIQCAELLYENLDWNDGSEGKFGPLAASRFWDYIVLSDCTYNVDSFPVLVKTLSAIHSHNMTYLAQSNNTTPVATTPTKVILSTKHRHDSETALFGMLQEAGWQHRLLKSIPLGILGEEDESVEVYSLQKIGNTKSGRPNKRKTSDEDGAPAKKKTVA